MTDKKRYSMATLVSVATVGLLFAVVSYVQGQSDFAEWAHSTKVLFIAFAIWATGLSFICSERI